MSRNPHEQPSREHRFVDRLRSRAAAVGNFILLSLVEYGAFNTTQYGAIHEMRSQTERPDHGLIHEPSADDREHGEPVTYRPTD